jgi:hypothetical protein
MKNTPLAFVREWIRSLSAIVRKTPAKAIATWCQRDGNLSIRLLKYEVRIDSYHTAVKSTLQECMLHIRSKVLFNIDLPKSCFQLPDDKDPQDETTRGYGIFSFATDSDSDDFGESGSRAASSILLQALSKLGALCRWDATSNSLQWDTNVLSQWLMDVSLAWEYVYILMHLLALPARGTEEELWQHANAPESGRHLFISPSLQTLVTKSNYNKTSSSTGIYKTIIRVIPHQVSEAITILLGMVRPIELVAILQFQCSTPAQAQNVTHLYQTRLFATMGLAWDSERMSLILRTWFMRHLGVPFSMRLHRQFAQALQRKFLSYKRPNPMAEVANMALGHTQRVAEMHYAIETEDLAVPRSLLERFEAVGRDWIEWHGVPVMAEKK